MKNRVLKLRDISYYKLFIIYGVTVITVFHTVNLIFHGAFFRSVLLNPMNAFDDYFMHIGYASAPFGTNIYAFDENACFPPLAYLIYAFLGRCVGYYADDPTNTKIHQLVFYNMTVYILYTVVCIVLIIYATSLFIKKRGFVHQVILPCILILTYPVCCAAIQRGNSVLLAVPLIAIAIAWRDDESKRKRELALIIIAIAAGLKIYPALLGLLYIKEKRWKETLRLIIYGVILFFAPFVFFGGIEGLKTFLHTLFNLGGEIHRCSVSGLVDAVSRILFGRTIHGFTVMMQQLFLVICIATFFITKDKWGEILSLCSLMAVYLSSSWMYTCVYIIPVLLVFFAEKKNKPIRIDKGNWTDLIGFTMFLCVFSFSYHMGYAFIYDSITVLTVLYGVAVIMRFIYGKIYSKISGAPA